jgi:hypothetical protein
LKDENAGGFEWKEASLALHVRQIPVLLLVVLRHIFHKLQEEAQSVALTGVHVGVLQLDAKRRLVLGDDAPDHNSLNPNLAVIGPQADFQLGIRAHRLHRLDKAATRAHVSQVAPDRSFPTLAAQLNGDEAAHSWICAAVLPK